MIGRYDRQLLEMLRVASAYDGAGERRLRREYPREFEHAERAGLVEPFGGAFRLTPAGRERVATDRDPAVAGALRKCGISDPWVSYPAPAGGTVKASGQLEIAGDTYRLFITADLRRRGVARFEPRFCWRLETLDLDTVVNGECAALADVPDAVRIAVEARVTGLLSFALHMGSDLGELLADSHAMAARLREVGQHRHLAVVPEAE